MEVLLHGTVHKSISKSLFKSRSLNHHLESHLHKNHFLYLFTLMHILESHSLLLFLASEKSGIEDAYIWMTI
jgi:hypothetical protein